jgi:hypothetical protein
VADARATLLPLARRALFEEDRRRGASRWIEARGASMRPLIAPGTWMLVDFGARPGGTGEIALLRRGDTIVAHRVVATIRRETGSLLVTKGDAEPFCDAPVSVEDVIGVVRALRRAPGGRPTTLGCAGRPARMIGRISGWSGRSAFRVRRLAPFLPVRLRRLTRPAVLHLARTATRLVAAPMASAANAPTTEHERR